MRFGYNGNYGYGGYGYEDCDIKSMKAEIAELKQGFYDAVDEARTSYAAEIASFQEDSDARRIENNAKIAMDFDAILSDLITDTNANVASLVLSNDQRRSDFGSDSQALLAAYLAEIDGAKDEINAWVDKKIEWVEAQYKADKHHVKSAIQKLEKWRSSAWAELSRRAATARSIVDECTLALGKALDEFEEDLQEHGEETISAFEAFGAAVIE